MKSYTALFLIFGTTVGIIVYALWHQPLIMVAGAGLGVIIGAICDAQVKRRN